MFKHKKILIISIFAMLLFNGNFASADSCLCTTYSTGQAGACEKKSESDCYAKLNANTGCSFFTDDACKNISSPLAPGLAWTEGECVSAKGEWRPPNTGVKNGPYCYENQNFSEPYNLSVDILGANKTGISNLGQYINLAYKLIVGLAIFFSIIMVTVAGFQWLTSGGNAGKIGEAKKKIFNAIIGLLLAVGAYTILQTINPRLLELNLPLIPKIKTLNYVGVTGCGGYKTIADCQKNPVGFNGGIAVFAPSGYSGIGCAWDAVSNSCVQKESKGSGYLGGLCLAGDTCFGELKCVTTANIKVCTDGNANSVCGYGQNNNGCKQGLTCDTSLASICYDPNAKRPQGVPCDNSTQCSGGICGSNGRCTSSTQCDDTHTCPEGQDCLLAGTGNNAYRQCAKPTVCYSNDNCTLTYGQNSFCPASLSKQAQNIFQTNYISGQYPINGTKDSPYSVCKYTLSSNSICDFDDECASRSCINKKLVGTTEQGVCQ